MKICLINPPQVLRKSLGAPFVFQPLGLMYIAAVLEKEHTVNIIDASALGAKQLKEVNGRYCLGIDINDIIKKITTEKPDVVGISMPFSVNSAPALNIARIVKQADENIMVFAGGAHPTARPESVLSCGDVDFVIMGEGEKTILELLNALRASPRGSLKDIKGIAYKENGKIIVNEKREWINDLDALPNPARHLFPMEEYFSAMKTNRGARQPYTYNQRWVSVITSRGCPYNCNFCSIHGVMGWKFRARSPEGIIEEIKQCVNEYDIKHVNFEDDNLTFDKKRAERIFDLIIENKLDITWSAPNGIRADAIDENLVEKMKQSGCKRVFVAPESGVQRVVTDIIGKKLDLKKIEEAVLLFKKHGIIVDGSFVIGFPGETKQDMQNTVKYALKLKKAGMDTAGIHIATPYYGTRLYEESEQKGFLRKDLNDSLFTTGEPLISTNEWTLDDVRNIYNKAEMLINYSGIKRKSAYILYKYFPHLFNILKITKNNLIYFFKIFPGKINLVKNYYKNMLFSRVNKLPKVKGVVYEITDACNSRCVHCNIWKQAPAKDVLTEEEIEKLFKDDFFSCLKVVLLTGGEPVLRNDLEQVISVIHNARPFAKIVLSTNGLLPERVLDVVESAIFKNIPISIGISLDAAGEKNDLIRGVKGSFQKTDYLVRELVKLRDKHQHLIEDITIGHTLSNLTADTLEEVKSYADRLGVNFLTQLYEEFSYYCNADKSGTHELENYHRADNAPLIKALDILPVSFHNEILHNALAGKLNFKCDAMKSFFVLRCDGSVVPCLNYSGISAGNVRNYSINRIWKSPEAQKARKLAAGCRGCSNSWAAQWSFEANFTPFIKLMYSLIRKKMARKRTGEA